MGEAERDQINELARKSRPLAPKVRPIFATRLQGSLLPSDSVMGEFEQFERFELELLELCCNYYFAPLIT